MRTLIGFPCAGETLVGTVDPASGSTGVLIVSGGNEVRAGAHRGMALLAGRLATRGVPVFRFDRRGVGDSSGENGGWGASGPDIVAAVDAFRASQPHVARIVGFGNCDGATALALFGRAAGIGALAIANPWLGDGDALPPPVAIRARYAARLRDPQAWRRLLLGRIDARLLFRGLCKLARPGPGSPLSGRLAAALAKTPTAIVLAVGDRTAQTFADAWQGAAFDAVRAAIDVTSLPTGSHSFVGDLHALETAILAAVERLAASG